MLKVVYSPKMKVIHLLNLPECCGNCEHYQSCQKLLHNISYESTCDFVPSRFMLKEDSYYA